jgi:rhomboid family protein
MDKFRLWFYSQPRAIRKLLGVNVVMYLGWNLVLVHFQPTSAFVYNFLALNSDASQVIFRPWQLLTYSFLHLGPGMGGFLHILFNMLWLVWIGRDFEEVYGAPRLFNIYVLGSVGGAVATLGLHAAFPSIGAFGGIVNGASASVMAVMTIVAVVQPQKSIGLLFIGIVRIKYIVLGFLFLDILWSSSGGTSISAHWGGALAGLLVGRAFIAGTDLSGWAVPLFEHRTLRQRNQRSRDHSASNSPKSGFMGSLESWAGGRSKPKESPHGGQIRRGRKPSGTEMAGLVGDDSDSATPESQAEIDAILDKISSTGYDSLSDTEKQTLYGAGEG